MALAGDLDEVFDPAVPPGACTRGYHRWQLELERKAEDLYALAQVPILCGPERDTDVDQRHSRRAGFSLGL
jgi:hypothetical protein